MPFHPSMQEALNGQLLHEFESAYLYLAMSAHLGSRDFAGSAHWMRLQAREEVAHAMRLYDFVANRGATIRLGAVGEPPRSWDSPLATWEAALAHEQKMTDRLNALVELALKERDHATNNLLAWFVNEQVEEEATLKSIVQRLKRIGGDGSGLMLFDLELGKRRPPPAAAAG